MGGDLKRANGIRQAKRGQIPNGVFRQNPGVLAGPRLNVAWDIFGNGRTVLRAGAGVFYNRVQGNYQYAALAAPPNAVGVHADSWGASNNDITLGNLSLFSPSLASCRAVGNCPSILTQDLNSNRVRTTATVSVSLARRLPFENLFEADYVVTFGSHLLERCPAI